MTETLPTTSHYRALQRPGLCFYPTTTMSRPSSSPRRSDSALPKKAEAETSVGVEPAGFDAEVAAAAPLLRGPALTAAIAFVAGTGFTLFGCVFGYPRGRRDKSC